MRQSRKPARRFFPRIVGVPVVGHALFVLPIDPASNAAAYLAAMPTGIPLHPPVLLRVTFTLQAPGQLSGPCADKPAWHIGTPSLLEQQAVLLRALQQHAYLAYAADVSCHLFAKRWGSVPGVRVYLRTLLGPDDDGLEFPVDADAAAGAVEPLPPRPREDANLDAGERPLPFQPRTAPTAKRSRK